MVMQIGRISDTNALVLVVLSYYSDVFLSTGFLCLVMCKGLVWFYCSTCYYCCCCSIACDVLLLMLLFLATGPCHFLYASLLYWCFFLLLLFDVLKLKILGLVPIYVGFIINLIHHMMCHGNAHGT